MRRPWPTGDCCAKNKQTNKFADMDLSLPLGLITCCRIVLEKIKGTKFNGLNSSTAEDLNISKY